MKKILLLLSLYLLTACGMQEDKNNSETSEISSDLTQPATTIQEASSNNERAAQAKKELDLIFEKYSRRFEEETPVLIEEMKSEIGEDSNNVIKRGQVYSEKLLAFGEIFLEASQEAALVANEYGSDAISALDNWTQDLQKKSGEYKQIIEKAYNDLKSVQ